MMKWPVLPLEDYFRFNENFKEMPANANNGTSSSTVNGTNHLTSFDHMVREVDRFNSFYNDVLRFHDLLENIDNILLRRQLREIMNKIEDDFVNEPDLTTPKCLMYNTLRLGVIGGSLSGKSALLQRYITGKYSSEDALPGRHKKVIDVNGTSNLLLIRDETGPPDPQLSLWLDGVMLVFNMTDELSFNVISSYYAKILQNRTDKELPCILVAIKDVENTDNSCGVVEDTRIKKFIAEHRKCPCYYVSLESGDNIESAFQMAAEKIVQYQNAQLFPPTMLSSSASFTSLNSSDGFFSSTLSKKQIKRRNTLFSMKTSEKKEKEKEKDEKTLAGDDIGSGRQIPVKQGYLYKRHQSSKREWKKKFVLITDDQVFSYYPSMKDYMDDANVKSIKLIHSSVKVPGKRKANNQGLYRSNSKSHSSQNLSNILSSPIKNRSNRNSASDPLENQDCYVISNSSISDPSTDIELTSGSPTIHNFIERSSSDGRDVGPPQNLRNAQSQEAVTSKNKHRNKANRYKSCEIDYQGTNGHKTPTSDGDVTPVMTPVIRKRSMQHRRQKSGTNIREAIQDIALRGTDTEDDDCVFTLTNIDGKTWHFECTSAEERDSWVRIIEQQILKAYQDSTPRTPGTDDSSRPPANHENGLNVQERLFAIPGNEVCADCSSQAPEWVSLNLGILICIECSGVHRNLGTHLSKVRSLLLDDWPPEYFAVLEGLGNEYVNSIYEANISGKTKPKANAKREEREKWISQKYEKHEFVTSANGNTMCQDLMSSVMKNDLRSCYLALLHSDSSSLNTLYSQDVFDYKVSPLHMACFHGSVPIAQLLLWSSADPKILDERCFNPIFYANKSGNKQCAELLFSYGCPEDTPC